MKNYYYLLIILLISCNSGNEKKDQSLKEVAVRDAFSISKENLKVNELSSDKIIIKRNEDDELQQLIVYTNGSMEDFPINNETIINEGGVYVIITETDIKVLNTTSKMKDTHLYKIIQHYAGLKNQLGVEISNLYIADSCIATGTDIEGTEKTKTFMFNQILEPNIKQLIVETASGIFIYKIDLENEPVIYEDIEPIYKLSLTSWFNYDDAPIEKIFLDETKSFIETRETDFTNHSHSISDTSLEWEANNKKQVFSIKKNRLIKTILDEI